MCHPGWPCNIAMLLRDGVRMGFSGLPPAEHRFPQRHTAKEAEAIEICAALDGYYPKGIVEGAWTSREMAEVICTSPLYAVPKKGIPYKRTIFDASSWILTCYNGVNSLIPDEWVQTALPSVRALRNTIVDAGVGAWLWTIDVKAAFLNIPVHVLDRPLLAFEFNGVISRYRVAHFRGSQLAAGCDETARASTYSAF